MGFNDFDIFKQKAVSCQRHMLAPESVFPNQPWVRAQFWEPELEAQGRPCCCPSGRQKVAMLG